MASSTYHRLENEEDLEPCLSSSEKGQILRPYYRLSLNWRDALLGVFTGMILGFALSAFLSLQGATKGEMWSPAQSIFSEKDWSIRNFNGLQDGRAPPYRGGPSDDVDEAWEKLSPHGKSLLRLSSEQLQRLDPSMSKYAAKYTDEMGGGYIASLEVFHQVHCVNMLRKGTRRDYYTPREHEWTKEPEILEEHLDHCADMLRDKLMCNPDLGMVTYIWREGFKYVFPNFATPHQCRDYSKVLDWMHKNSVHQVNVTDLQRAPGWENLPNSEERGRKLTRPS